MKPQRNRKAMSCDAGTTSAGSFSAPQVVTLYAVYLCVYIYVDLRVRCLFLTVNLCFLSSLNSGTDRESPNNVEKPPNRKPPVKKPRLPQNRNKSLDLSGTCLCFYLCLCVADVTECDLSGNHTVQYFFTLYCMLLPLTSVLDVRFLLVVISLFRFFLWFRSALQTASVVHLVTASCCDS